MTDQVIFLVVCTANVCRSPAAEIILNDALAEIDATPVVRAVSAGVGAADGEPMCAQARDRLGRTSAEHVSRRDRTSRWWLSRCCKALFTVDVRVGGRPRALTSNCNSL
jgi:protein-tyrosine-phosphatase